MSAGCCPEAVNLSLTVLYVPYSQGWSSASSSVQAWAEKGLSIYSNRWTDPGG